MNILTPVSSAMAISCPFCYVNSGTMCTAPSGTRKHPHHARWKAADRMCRSREMWFVMCEDDERFGLVAGDIVRCVNYPYDAKVSVLFREWDGYDPECNQYKHSVAFLGFVPRDMEIGR